LLALLNEPRIGVARFAARELGVLAGRNWLLSLLISLLRLGSFAVTTTATIHSARTTQRKRTTVRPSRRRSGQAVRRASQRRSSSARRGAQRDLVRGFAAPHAQRWSR
jgi:hypothetical protein